MAPSLLKFRSRYFDVLVRLSFPSLRLCPPSVSPKQLGDVVAEWRIAEAILAGPGICITRVAWDVPPFSKSPQ